MKLKDFLEKIIFEELADKFRELLNYDLEKYKLYDVCTLNGNIYRENEIENLYNKNVLFLSLVNCILYIGSGKLNKDGKCEIIFHSLRYLGSLSKIIFEPNIDNNMTGFIFKSTNIFNFTK